ncbi:MAG TPA: outer membrane protein assembly factor BamC [Chromatiales bacterium]|nr:outer membrane protein assembly factor BamC [Thiotrichales bacterium]HIP68443.1 outer membrane protein assembly factor BamC [Chromatiales bacterium]
MSKYFLILVLSILLFLSGCSIFGGNQKDAYKKSRATGNLEAPPELVIPETDTNYKVPDVVRASEVGNGSRTAGVATASGVVPEYESVTLERDGQLRWLHVKAAPEQIWQPLVNFWQQQEVKLEETDRALGIMRTEWIKSVRAENRGKISALFSKALGSIAGAELKEQYKIRVERVEDGSNIYLTYQATEKVFEETLSGESGPAHWQMRPADPEAEAEMLVRIQQYIAKL